MTKLVERVVFYPGQTIIREGDEGSRAYLIDSGEVKISKKLPNGGDVVLGTGGKGGIFGEMALVDDKPRMASVIAVRETICYVITRQTFQKKLADSDPFIRGLLTIFVRHIRQLTQSSAKKVEPPPPVNVVPAEGAPADAPTEAEGSETKETASS